MNNKVSKTRRLKISLFEMSLETDAKENWTGEKIGLK